MTFLLMCVCAHVRVRVRVSSAPFDRQHDQDDSAVISTRLNVNLPCPAGKEPTRTQKEGKEK